MYIYNYILETRQDIKFSQIVIYIYSTYYNRIFIMKKYSIYYIYIYTHTIHVSMHTHV